MTTFGKSAGGGRRKTPRARAPVLAILSTLSDDRRAAIVNLSRNGARLSAPDLPSEGEPIVFKADHVETFGRIVWRRGTECGLAFDSPISAAELDRLRLAANLPTVGGLSIDDPLCEEEQWRPFGT